MKKSNTPKIKAPNMFRVFIFGIISTTVMVFLVDKGIVHGTINEILGGGVAAVSLEAVVLIVTFLATLPIGLIFAWIVLYLKAILVFAFLMLVGPTLYEYGMWPQDYDSDLYD